jgi:serine/threonine protein kinase
VSTFTSEPGTRLGGRYRLEDRVAAAAGWAAWKAIDETLARAVTVLTFAPGFPRLREVVTAARAASRLNDSRFAQVFDVEDDWDHAYIVSEWAAGDSLDDMLTNGPLDAARGARIIAEAAEAISAAHAAGLAHLCLSPDSLRWTAGGGVKITGLGIDAALTGASSDDPGLADTHRLGMLLYATLTGHWPGPDCPTLPPAPVQDGLPCSPRQVRAGVPAVLDEITTQALMLDGRDGNALTTPDQLSAALVEAIPPVPIPQLPPPPSRPAPRPAPRSQTRGRSRADSHRHPAGPTREDMYSRGNPYGRPDEYLYPDEQEPGYWPQDGQGATRPVTRGGGGRGGGPARRGGASRSRTIAIVAVVVVVAVALVVFALTSLNHGGTKTPPPTSSHHSGAPKTSSAAATLTPVGASAFEDNPADANMAIDNNPSTAWQTFQYIGNPVFGGLQQGSGLILNMGHSVKLSSVKVTFQTTPGADVQIKIGNPSNPSPPQGNQADVSQAESIADSMPTVAQQSNVSGTVTFTINSSDSGQYVLIWFTKLAPMPNHPNKYQGSIFNVVVTGSG